jgi:glycosyltransferase involved in cell wall biosynthesis
MRFLWISDSPDTPSGFGNVTRFVCEGLARRGHGVSILGWQTKQKHTWNGCNIYPVGINPLGSDALFPFLVGHRPDIVVALGDVWWLPYFSAPHVRRQMELTDTPWALYFPIDGNMEGERLPPSWIELLREVDVPIAMSRYGQRIVSQCGVSCHYIPHGVDPNVFFPPSNREEAKARIGAQGKFLVLSDSRNQPRKMLPRLIEIFAKFAAERPDTLLHLHTDPDDEFTKSGVYSYDIYADLRHLGIESKVRFTAGLAMKRGGGIPLNELAAYYQAADVHLLASSGEGFGLPTLQAAAAGAVPMAGAYSASQELLEGHGEAIQIAEWGENEFGIRRGLIDIDDAVRKLAKYYDNRDLLVERSAQSRQFAMSYGWNEVVDQWDMLLRSICNRKGRIVKMSRAKSVPVENVLPQMIPLIAAGSVKVNIVERQFGRLEAGIIADTRGNLSDIRIPAVQQACQVANLRVLRNPGYIGLAARDEAIFFALKCIFPVLAGWVPSWSPSATATDENLNVLPLDNWKEARYELAQSVLLLNVSGEFPEATLIDAALFGVPCVGTGESEMQRVFWPELAVEDGRRAADLARTLLTNAARLRRLASRARAACQDSYKPSQEEAAEWLRKLHSAQSSAALAAKG